MSLTGRLLDFQRRVPDYFEEVNNSESVYVGIGGGNNARGRNSDDVHDGGVCNSENKEMKKKRIKRDGNR